MTTHPTLSFGKQITAPADVLSPLTISDVAGQIRADTVLQQQTARLRKLMAFDRVAYRTAKTSLPYVVGAVFANGVRRTTALEAATFFVLDVDRCTGLANNVPDAVRADLSVMLAFVSPSGEGLKLFFRLLTPCPDPKAFSAAYRAFAADFGAQHGFADSLDLRTADATRACFLAHDPNPHHNPDAMPVDWRIWLQPDPFADTDEPTFVEQDTETPERTARATRKPAAERPINEAAYGNVLRAMNPNAPVRPQKQTFVPDALTELEPAIRTICASLSWELTDLTPLNYGLKVAVKQGFRRAEVNVHYGKKGYSVVVSPKTGTDPALAKLLHGQLFGLLFPDRVATEAVLDTLTVSLN